MIPYFLALVGGYLIGSSRRGKSFAKGGVADGTMTDGGLTDEIILQYHKTSGGAEYLLSSPPKTLKQKNLLSQSARFGDAKYIVRIDGAKTHGGELLISNYLFDQAIGRGMYSQEVSDEADKKIVELGLQKEFEEYRKNGKIIIKLFYHKTTGGAEYLCSSKVKGSKDEGSFDSKYIVRIDGAKNHGGELLIKDIKEEDTYAEGGDIEEFSLWVIGDEPQKIKTGTSRAIKSYYTKNKYTDQFNEWRKKGYGIQQWPADTTKEEIVRYNKSERGSATSQEYADGGLMKDFEKNFTTAYILQQQLENKNPKGVVSDSYDTMYYNEKYYPIRYHNDQSFASKELHKDLRDSSGELKGSDEKEIEEKITAYFEEDEIKKLGGDTLHDKWKNGEGISVEKKKKRWFAKGVETGTKKIKIKVFKAYSKSKKPWYVTTEKMSKKEFDKYVNDEKVKEFNENDSWRVDTEDTYSWEKGFVNKLSD